MCDVSVITLLKKRHVKVKENVNSLINQTLTNTEIICVYKEENKEIDEFVKKAQKTHPNIKIIYKTKAQDVVAKNNAIEQADGKYVLIMNGNMSLEKTALEKMYKACEKNKTEMAICGYNIIDNKTNNIISKGLNNKFSEVEQLDGNNKNFAYLNLDAGNKLIKKNMIQNTRFQNYDECQDEIFILSLYAKINKISFINDELYFKYEILNNTEAKSPIQVKDLQKGLIEVKKILKDAGKYKKMQNILSFIAFTKVGVRSLIELSYSSSDGMKESTREIMNYLDINFFEWRKNPFLKLKNVPRKSYWTAYISYKFGFQQLFIKTYRELIEKGSKALIF